MLCHAVLVHGLCNSWCVHVYGVLATLAAAEPFAAFCMPAIEGCKADPGCDKCTLLLNDMHQGIALGHCNVPSWASIQLPYVCPQSLATLSVIADASYDACLGIALQALARYCGKEQACVGCTS